MLVKQFDYISKEESQRLIDNIKNIKHKTITLLMLDCGLRVSETITLKFKNFDFKQRTVTIQSLKKRGKDKLRSIPLSDRLYRCFSEYLKDRILSLEPNAYVFPSYTEKGHISRKQVWKFTKQYGSKFNITKLHPHTLRHTFATHHLSAGTTLPQIREMLGHSNFNTTLIYAEIPTNELKERVNTVTNKPVPFYIKWFKKITQKPLKIINLNHSESYYTIGRNEELNTLNANAEKGINTILIGKIGVGKSHLLNNIETSKKVLTLDDTESIKKSLVGVLLYFYKKKETVASMLWKDFTIDEVTKKIQRENIIQLCDTIKASVKPKEYILIIDDITRITPTGRKALERLKETFVIIAGARSVKANDTSFIWDFEVLKIKELSRRFAMELINQMSSGVEAENPEVFRNHIYDQTNGNPRAIHELIERYRKEPFLTNEVVREIKHVGALKEIDMSIMIILFLGVITCLRYMAKEMDEPAFKFIGSVALIILLMLRPMMKSFKRQFV